MNTTELARCDDWDEQELKDLVAGFVRCYRRLPSYRDLVRHRRARNALHLRIPRQTRRKAARLIATL